MNNARVLMLIQKIIKLYQSYAKPVLNKYSMTQAEFDILAFLANNPELNTARDICEVRMLKKSIVCQSIDKLVTKGYVYKKSDPSDKRVLHLLMTDSASIIVEEIKKVQENYLSTIFSNFTYSDMSELYSLLIKLESNILNTSDFEEIKNG